MNKEEFFEKLDGLLNNAKSKGFISHLIRAYYPNGSVEKVYETPKGGKFNCSLTNQKLISVNDILKEIHSEEYKENFFKSLHQIIENDNIKAATTTKLEQVKLGFKGTKTDTYLSAEAYQMLVEWVFYKIMQNDSNVMWILKDILGRPKKKFVKKPEVKKASYSIGDLLKQKGITLK